MDEMTRCIEDTATAVKLAGVLLREASRIEREEACRPCTTTEHSFRPAVAPLPAPITAGYTRKLAQQCYARAHNSTKRQLYVLETLCWSFKEAVDQRALTSFYGSHSPHSSSGASSEPTVRGSPPPASGRTSRLQRNQARLVARSPRGVKRKHSPEPRTSHRKESHLKRSNAHLDNDGHTPCQAEQQYPSKKRTLAAAQSSTSLASLPASPITPPPYYHDLIAIPFHVSPTEAPYKCPQQVPRAYRTISLQFRAPALCTLTAHICDTFRTDLKTTNNIVSSSAGKQQPSVFFINRPTMLVATASSTLTQEWLNVNFDLIKAPYIDTTTIAAATKLYVDYCTTQRRSSSSYSLDQHSSQLLLAACIVLANKVLNDTAPTTKWWAHFWEIERGDLLEKERTVLKALEWRVQIDAEALCQWWDVLERVARAVGV